MLKKLLLVLIGLTLSPWTIHATEPPASFQTQQGSEILVLGKSLELYLKKNLPGYSVPTVADKKNDWKTFTTPAQLPPVHVIGDFNGDKMPDIALLLKKHDDTGAFVITHQVGPGEFQHIVLAAEIENLSTMGISGLKAGESFEGITGKTSQREKMTLKNDAVSFFAFESAGSVFYWDGRKYKQVWRSD